MATLESLYRLRERALPEHQRRSLAELDEELDLTSGDSSAKQSAFWTMLVLSAVIASAGVLSDSTATVIGAMIIAPLSTPIMGIALSIVEQRWNGSIRFVLLGAITVTTVGVIFSLAVPGDISLLSNSQISSRTSPGLADLVAAVATGLAGAVALSRRDVAAVLPGVAIAISLVPPLAVVGVCLGQGEPSLAAGAFVLFLSNLLAMVSAGVLMYAALGYTEDSARGRGERGLKRAAPLVVIATMSLVVLVPLAANTYATYALAKYDAEVRATTETWLSSTPDASVTDVDFTSLSQAHISVRYTGQLPPYSALLEDLQGVVPDGITVYVDSSVGSNQEIGDVGSD